MSAKERGKEFERKDVINRELFKRLKTDEFLLKRR